MPTIVTHPDNAEALRSRLNTGEFDRGSLFESFTIRLNSNVHPDKPTGRFVMPGGRVVDRDEVFWGTHYVDYGPSDIRFLLFTGVIREEREMVFYVLNESLFKFYDMPMVMDRPIIMTTA